LAPQPFDLRRHTLAFRLEELGNRAPKTTVGDEVRARGHHRLVAPGDFVLALRAGLNGCEAVLDSPLDRAVVAELEVKEGHLLRAAPIAAVERVRPDEVERTGDRMAAAAGEEQQDGIAHPLADQAEEFARGAR